MPLSVPSLPHYFGYNARALFSSARKCLVPAIDRASARVNVDAPLLEAMLAKVDPTLSLQRVRAEVVTVVDETADAKSL